MEIPVWPAARLLWFLHASSRQSTRAILPSTPDCVCPSRKVPAGQLPPRYLASMWCRMARETEALTCLLDRRRYPLRRLAKMLMLVRTRYRSPRCCSRIHCRFCHPLRFWSAKTNFPPRPWTARWKPYRSWSLPPILAGWYALC